MEFLVRLEFAFPDDMPEARRAEILGAEHEHALRLRRDGAITRIWRLPGTTVNVGVWEAVDATSLHQLLAGLPLFPWMSADVTALADHPLEQHD